MYFQKVNDKHKYKKHIKPDFQKKIKAIFY
jgi:hypothetical protein